MFVVRQSQIEAFSRAAAGTFVERMVAHLRRVFPHESAALGEVELRARVREGLERAARHGLEREYHVCLYLHVMMALGSRFDEDPELPWARALLEDPAFGPATGVSILHDRVFETEVDPTLEREAH